MTEKTQRGSPATSASVAKPGHASGLVAENHRAALSTADNRTDKKLSHGQKA